MKKSEKNKYIDKKLKLFPVHYAIKYKIDSLGLTHQELMYAIHRYEMNHLIQLIDLGRDKYTNEIGYYIQS